MRCLSGHSTHCQTIAHKHESMQDAQAVFKEFVKCGMKSAQALILMQQKLTHLVMVKLGNGAWNGTKEGLILHWMQTHHNWLKPQDGSTSLSDSFKCALPENTVDKTEELHGVKQSLHLVWPQSSDHDIPFEEHATVPQEAAQSLNKSSEPTIRAKSKHKAHPVKGKCQARNLKPRFATCCARVAKTQAQTGRRRTTKVLLSW